MIDAAQKQREAEFLVHMNFGRAYGAALDAQSSLDAPQQRKEAAAAILATSISTSNRDTSTLKHDDARNGRIAMEKAYKDQAPNLTAVLSGRVANYDLPKSFEGTQDLAQLVSKGQLFAQAAIRDNYASRGMMTSFGKRDDYMLLAKGSHSETIEKLTTHMLHVKSSIESSVDHNTLDRKSADALYARFQNATFSTGDMNQTGRNLKSAEFISFEKSEVPKLKDQVSFDVETRYALMKSSVERVQSKEQNTTQEVTNINQEKGLSTMSKDLNKGFQAANTHVSLPIGSKMVVSEHKTAIAKLGGENVGSVELPKQSCAYTGKIIQASDTHIIQQVSPTMAIAHDMSKLSNSKDLIALAEQGKLRNANLKVSYDDKQGVAKPIVLDKDRIAETMIKAKEFSNTLAQPQSRDAFMKHIENIAITRQQQPNLQKLTAQAPKPAQPTQPMQR